MECDQSREAVTIRLSKLSAAAANWDPRALLDYLLAPLNLRVVPAGEVDPLPISPEIEELRAGEYFRWNQPFLVEMPLDYGRDFTGYSLGNNGSHPMIQVARELRRGVSTASRLKAKSLLLDFYDHPRAISGSELLGVPHDHFSSEPIWSAVFPWQPQGVDEWRSSMERAARLESKRFGFRLLIRDGWTWMGPVTAEKLTLEITRIQHIVREIQARGYQRRNLFDGDIRAFLLVSNSGEIRWHCISGNHRAIALSGLGFSSVPIRIERVVREDEVKFWPHVREGTFTSCQASTIFKNIFNGRS